MTYLNLNAVKAISLFLFVYGLVFSQVMAKSNVTTDQFRVHGLSSFNTKQQEKLSNWLTKGVNATRATLGVYPQVLEIYVYPKRSNQPVPWAHTRRDALESVHFYVDTRFPLKKFVNDWTIYHEMAHLALPYLGSHYSWFSEGFASFMQYQIMHEVGILQGTLEESYQKKIAPHLRWFNSQLPAAEVARRLMEKRNYPAGYWGGAYFFIIADKKLRKEQNVSLTTLISFYQECCREQDNSIQDLVKSLDGLIEDTLFSDLLNQFEKAPAKTLYPEVF